MNEYLLVHITLFMYTFCCFYSFFQISDLKRLNKIEKEIEIHARKTIKVPMNAHTVLLNTTNSDELPIVHKSGQNSPKHPKDDSSNDISNSIRDINSINTNQLLPNDIRDLDEKLLVASVSLASTVNPIYNKNSTGQDSNSNSLHSNDVYNMNDIIMNSKIATPKKYKDHATNPNRSNEMQSTEDDYLFTDPLLMDLNDTNDDMYDSSYSAGSPHAIRGAPNDFSCSGSDCDISWICLLIFILALCFAIPLIYIIYIAEHPEEFIHKDD